MNRGINRRVFYSKFGRPDVLDIVNDSEIPQISDDEVLIRTESVSINPKDTLLRKGKFSKTLGRDPLPRGTALDASGVVVKVGSKVAGLSEGDRVFAMTNRFCGGLMADFIALPESEVALAPTVIALNDSSSIPLAGLTALQGLRDCGRVQPGASVLIVGSAGGVGHFACQIAVAMGADVSAVCSAKNRKYTQSLGVKETICYDEVDILKLEASFDVVFDVSGKYEPNQFKSVLASRGSFVSTVPKPSSIFGELLSRLRISHRSRLVIVKSNSDDLCQLAGMVNLGQLKPTVSHRFSLSEVALAHHQMETGHTVGKIIVELNEQEKKRELIPD